MADMTDINASGFGALLAMMAGRQPIDAAAPDSDVDDLGVDLADDGSDDDVIAGAYSEGDSVEGDSVEDAYGARECKGDAPALTALTAITAITACTACEQLHGAPCHGSVRIMVDPRASLVLADDPQIAVAVNTAHRRIDVPDGLGSDLYAVEQVCRILPRQYIYSVQTFAPHHWPTAKPINQAEYGARFAAEFPEIAHILPLDNIIVAGGAAAFPLGESSVTVGDVDLYVYGIDAADQIALWTVVDSVVRKLRRAHMRGVPGCARRAHSIVETMSPGCITLRMCYTDDDWQHRLNHAKERSVQIILRAYPTVSSILHGFDIPSCCVAYDGRVAATTTLGAYAIVFRCNPVVPAYRSTTYERRLEKYFNRGYAIALPNCRRDALQRGVPFVMPYLTLEPRVVRGRFAVGEMSLPPGSMHSDYGAPAHRSRSTWSLTETAAYTPNAVNARQISANTTRFVVMDVVTKRDTSRRRWRGDPGKIGLPFESYAAAEPTRDDILPRAFYMELLNSHARGVVNGRGQINITTLLRVFGLETAEVATFAAAVAAAAAASPGRKIDASLALARFIHTLLARYDALPNAIDWWVVTDPSRQYTGSINPIIEEPVQWYGEAAFELNVPPATADDFVLALMATLESRASGPSGQTVYDGICPLCHDTLIRGESNSVILACGHIFHWAENNECTGLFGWAVDHSDCPTCRREFTREGNAAEPAETPENPAIRIDIAW
jgi:hypothetical protein